MAHGLTYYVLVFLGGLGGLIWVHLLCKYHYAKGRTEGIHDEAIAWCEALDNVMVPNWQSLPIDPALDRKEQETVNKIYVEAFRAAKAVIGFEAAENRLEAIRKEYIRLGFLPPSSNDVQRS